MGEGTWKTPDFLDIVENENSRILWLCSFIFIGGVFVANIFLYKRYLGKFHFTSHEEYFMVWLYKCIASIPLFVAGYAFFSIFALKLGVLLRPAVEVVEGILLYLVFEVYVEIMGGPASLLAIAEKEGIVRKWAAAQPCCCFKPCSNDMVFNSSLYNRANFLVKQFCYVIPIAAIIEMSCIISGKEGPFYYISQVAKALGITMAVYGVMIVEQFTHYHVKEAKIDLFFKFVACKLTIVAVTVQAVFFEKGHFEAIGALEESGTRLIIFLNAITVESILLSLLVFNYFPPSDMEEVKTLRESQTSGGAYSATPVQLKTKGSGAVQRSTELTVVDDAKKKVDETPAKSYGSVEVAQSPTQSEVASEISSALLLSSGIRVQKAKVDLRERKCPCSQLNPFSHVYCNKQF